MQSTPLQTLSIINQNQKNSDISVYLKLGLYFSKVRTVPSHQHFYYLLKSIALLPTWAVNTVMNSLRNFKVKPSLLVTNNII
jgi:hypothetical protein